jgi:hypothetical protein
MKQQHSRRPHQKPVVRFTIADRLIARGSQTLRADECATSLTFGLTYAAKWAQAAPRRTGGAR